MSTACEQRLTKSPLTAQLASVWMWGETEIQRLIGQDTENYRTNPTETKNITCNILGHVYIIINKVIFLLLFCDGEKYLFSHIFHMPVYSSYCLENQPFLKLVKLASSLSLSSSTCHLLFQVTHCLQLHFTGRWLKQREWPPRVASLIPMLPFLKWLQQ